MSTISESRHLSTSASWGPRCSRRFTSLALVACGPGAVEGRLAKSICSGRVPSTWFGTTRAVADGSYPWRSSRSPTSNSPAPRSSS